MIQFRFLAACVLLAVWGTALAIDEPRYEVVRTHDVSEMRRYEAYLVAETTVRTSAEEAGNQGFRALAGHIFGGNKGARKIEMTAPVAQAPTKIVHGGSGDAKRKRRCLCGSVCDAFEMDARNATGTGRFEHHPARRAGAHAGSYRLLGDMVTEPL